MKRNFLVYLDDILESIDRIEEYTKGKTQEDFDSDIAFQDAVLRRLEIIGEAVRHIPDEIKDQYPEVEWKKISGARDVFIHGYFGVKLERVWDTVVNDLPKLKKQVKKILEEEK